MTHEWSCRTVPLWRILVVKVRVLATAHTSAACMECARDIQVFTHYTLLNFLFPNSYTALIRWTALTGAVHRIIRFFTTCTSLHLSYFSLTYPYVLHEQFYPTGSLKGIWPQNFLGATFLVCPLFTRGQPYPPVRAVETNALVVV